MNPVVTAAWKNNGANGRCYFMHEVLNLLPEYGFSRDWWAAFRDAWELTEYPWYYKDRINAVLPYHRGEMHRSHERTTLARLPDTLTIYRGQLAEQEVGLSWTLRRATAQFFARRSNGARRVIHTATVKKADATALLLRQGEREVITLKPSIVSTEVI